MMDEATVQLLSRHMDGDLSPSEAQELQAQLAATPALKEELAAMIELRDAVRAFAEQEEPPEELSALLEPLRRSRPPMVGVRPVFRWLAAAAVLVLGVTVGVEVAKQRPEPTPSSPPPQEAPEADVERQPFQLKPLPTPSGEELIGAVDHLMASPPPEEELDTPPPVDVVGPLEAPPRASSSRAEEEPHRSAPRYGVDSLPDAAVPAGTADGEEPLAFAPSPPPVAPAPEPVSEMDRREEQREKRALAETGVSATSGLRSRAVPDHELVLLVGGSELAFHCRNASSLPAGRSKVLVTVRRGEIVRLHLVTSSAGDAGETVREALLRCGDELVGRRVTDLSDGEIVGELLAR